VIAGLIALVVGYLLDFLSITPIIKRTSTSSFVLVSGGWVLLLMALLYWINDIRQFGKYAWIFTVVGMNSIFIYLFFETVGVQWLNGVVRIFTGGGVVSAIVTLLAEWYLCFWLYQKKIFFKL
jgi:predicted acyltransferase